MAVSLLLVSNSRAGQESFTPSLRQHMALGRFHEGELEPDAEFLGQGPGLLLLRSVNPLLYCSQKGRLGRVQSGGQDRLAVRLHQSTLRDLEDGDRMSLHGPQAAHQPYGVTPTCPRPHGAPRY